jgi:hypothetical protein
MDVKIACVCPRKADGTRRHDEDTVTLRDRLDFTVVVGMRSDVNIMRFRNAEGGHVSDGEILGLLTERYLFHGIASWTLEDESGKPLPATRRAIQDFLDEHLEEAYQVGEEADRIYSPIVVLPLILKASISKQPSPTDEPTSPTTDSSTPSSDEAPRKPSRRSSTSTTQTDSTAPTSPRLVGVYSSSPSSVTGD